METGNRIESFKGSFHHFSWKVFLTESQKNIGNTTYHITDIPAALVHENSNGKRRESGTPLHFPWCYTFFNQSYNGLMHWHKSYESHLPLYILSLKFRHPTSFKTSCIYQARAAPSRGLTRTSWAPTLSGDFCWWAVACRCDKSLGSEDLVKTTSW